MMYSKQILTLLTAFFCSIVMYSQGTSQAVQTDVHVLDNGMIRREIDCSNRQIVGKSYTLLKNNQGFIRKQSPEFSLQIDDQTFTGLNEWTQIEVRDTVAAKGGKGIILSFQQAEKNFVIELVYMVYPELPVVRKALRVANRGRQDMKIEAVDVEYLHLNWSATISWIMRQYARYKWLGPYTGNWDDPLIIVHDTGGDRGMAVGNEATGVIKRTTAFMDGGSMTAGLTHPEQTYAFRKWLRPGEQWNSPWVFTALYDESPDGFRALNITVPDFVRRHSDMRIDQLPQKPTFVYNTWSAFGPNINEALVRELAKAAAECGVEEFIIDDGWQTGVGSNDHTVESDAAGEWEVDKKSFPMDCAPYSTISNHLE